METYNGHVRTPTDAIILFEACRLGILPRVQRRLSEKERQQIRSGSVFVWDEREAGMRRWTDGKSWSASRVSGSFLTYREMEGKRGGNSFVTPANKGPKTSEGGGDDQQHAGEGEEGPDGYRYKPDGLMKQSFSITTSQGQHLHLISYYSRTHPTAQVLRQPSTDPALASIQPAKGMYPESTINDQSSVPAVTRSPMPGAPNYIISPAGPYGRPGAAHPHGYLPPGYMPHPAYIYPISPIHAPPAPYALQPYHAIPPGLPPLGYPSGPYGQPHALPVNSAPPSAYDQRPLRTTDTRSPQPPPPSHHPPPPPPPPPPIMPPPQNGSTPSNPLVSFSPAPPPPISSSYPPTLYAPAPSQKQESAAENVAVPSLQIDPRLTEAAGGHEAPPNGTVLPKPEDAKTESRPAENPPASASQAPTIGVLVNNTSPASPELKTRPEAEAEDLGSTSPGGTKAGAPPQDIPSEKLGFREDKRALSKLDRVFARV